MTNKIVLLLLALALLGCQLQKQESPMPITAESFHSGPQLVKIMLDGPDVMQNLEAQNIEIIVQEENYVIARLDMAVFGELQTMSLTIKKPEESDLVQRLIAVVISDKSQVTEVNNLGINIWEMRGDSVIAQAFDNQISDIETLGLPVTILENNIQNVVQKLGQK